MDNVLVDISQNNSVGEDLKYDDIYVKIEQEIDKDYSLNDESTDWKLVHDSCYEFLKSSSKDLKIAVWWVFASWQEDTWDGLHSSLIVLNKFIEKYHQDFFPKSKKARQNALIWLDTVLTNEIVEHKQHIDKLKHNTEIVEILSTTQDITKELLEVDDFYFTKVIRYLKTTVSKIEKVETVVKQPENKSMQHNITSISSDEDAKKVFQNFKKMASMLSEYYREKNSFDLKALRITRLLSWIGIDELPIEENGLTFINPPSEMTMMKLNELLENNQKEEAFKFLQSTLERSPYWLDGHYRSYEILEEFNKTQEAKEVKNELISFVSTHKGIDKLSFKDGKPFLSTSLVTQQSDTLNMEKIVNTSEENFSKKVQNIIQNHHMKEAIELLQNEYEKLLSFEENFKMRLEIVKDNSIKKHSNVLTAFLEGLETDVKKYHLEEWNPELALEVNMLLVKHFDGLKDKKEKVDRAYESISKLNISQMLNLK